MHTAYKCKFFYNYLNLLENKHCIMYLCEENVIMHYYDQYISCHHTALILLHYPTT